LFKYSRQYATSQPGFVMADQTPNAANNRCKGSAAEFASELICLVNEAARAAENLKIMYTLNCGIKRKIPNIYN
ncbi:MAG: hypothetical protein ABR534_16155, partial [Desulfotignum sp.]